MFFLTNLFMGCFLYKYKRGLSELLLGFVIVCLCVRAQDMLLCGPRLAPVPAIPPLPANT